MLNKRISSLNNLQTVHYISSWLLQVSVENTPSWFSPSQSWRPRSGEIHPGSTTSLNRCTKSRQTLPLSCGIYLARLTNIIPSVLQPRPLAAQWNNRGCSICNETIPLRRVLDPRARVHLTSGFQVAPKAVSNWLSAVAVHERLQNMVSNKWIQLLWSVLAAVMSYTSLPPGNHIPQGTPQVKTGMTVTGWNGSSVTGL